MVKVLAVMDWGIHWQPVARIFLVVHLLAPSHPVAIQARRELGLCFSDLFVFDFLFLRICNSTGLELWALLELLNGHLGGHAILNLEVPFSPRVPLPLFPCAFRVDIVNQLHDNLNHCCSRTGAELVY